MPETGTGPGDCVRGAGAVAVVDGSILLVRRARSPQAGRWSIPGGHVEPGETPESAAVREMAEETGLAVVCGDALFDVTVDIEGTWYWITDYHVTVLGRHDPVADDDADAVAWVPLDHVHRLTLVDGLWPLLAVLPM